MTRRSLLLSIAVAGIAGAGAFGWLTIRRGFSARDNPSAIEKLVATTARQLAVPSHYRQLDGARHAADRCSALMPSHQEIKRMQLLRCFYEAYVAIPFDG